MNMSLSLMSTLDAMDQMPLKKIASSEIILSSNAMKNSEHANDVQQDEGHCISVDEKQPSLYSLNLKEFAHLDHLLQLIPHHAQRGIITLDIKFTCIDVSSEFIAIGSTIGTVYIYDRHSGELERLRYEDYIGEITSLKLFSAVDALIAFGSVDGHVLVFLKPTKVNQTLPHRYDIINVHGQPVKSLEWDKSGALLYSGDQSGLVVETTFNFSQKTCKSREILKEPWSVVQLSYQDKTLVVSTLQRTLLCSLTDEGVILMQVGQRDRKSYGLYGATFVSSEFLFTSRPGFRLWKANRSGTVLETMLVKKSLESLNYESIELLKVDSNKSTMAGENENANQLPLQLEKLKTYLGIFILTWNRNSILVIDPETRSVIASCQNMKGNLLDIAVHQSEIFFIDDDHSVRRVASEPEDILYPQTSQPRLKRESFSFLSSIASPLPDFMKSAKANGSNTQDKKETSNKVINWLKNLTSSEKSTGSKEMQPIILPPVEKCNLTEALKLDSKVEPNQVISPNLSKTVNESAPVDMLIYHPKKKKKSKKKSKDMADSLSLDRSDSLQWDNFQSESPENLHNFDSEVIERHLSDTIDLPNDTSTNLKSPDEDAKSESVHLESEDEKLARILNLYTSVQKNKGIKDNEHSVIETNEATEVSNSACDNEFNEEANVDDLQVPESPMIDIYSNDMPEFYGTVTETDYDNDAFNANLKNNRKESNEELSLSKSELSTDEVASNSCIVMNASIMCPVDFSHFIEEWLQHKTPTNYPVISLSINKNYIYIIDSKENIFYSSINGHFVNWKSLNTPANQVAVSESSSLFWLLHQGVLYASKVDLDGKPTLPMLIAAKQVSSISLDDNSGWYITNGGKLYAQINLNSNKPCDKKPCLVPKYPCFPKQVVCCNNILWLSTYEAQLYCLEGISETNPLGIGFKKIHPPQGVKDISSISLTINGTGWLVDERGTVFFKINVTHNCPRGNLQWYRIEMNQFFLDEQGLKMPKAIEYTKDKLKQILSGNLKSVISSSGKGVWFFNPLSSSLLASRDNVIGHLWKLVKQDGTSTSKSFKWSLLSASGMCTPEDPIWAVYTTGELFCFNELDGQPISVASPTSDGSQITCLAPTVELLWVITSSGSIHVRNEISTTTPQGTYWTTLEDPQLDDIELIQLSCSKDVVWACDKSGGVWVRVGPLTLNKGMPPAWISIDEVDDHSYYIIKVSVGPNPSMVWGLSSNGTVYLREGVTTEMPIGERWAIVPGVQAKCLAVTRNAVWVLTVTGDIFYRYGIDANNACGDTWIKIPGSFSFITASPDNRLWVLDNNGNLFHHNITTIKFETTKSVHAKQNYLPYAPDMGEEWEVV